VHRPFVLAEAGLLDGRRATTHWHRARDLQARFPKVRWRKTAFSSSTARCGPRLDDRGIDLALAMIEKDLSAEVARAVARQLVVYHRRAGGQSQFSALLELEPKSDRIQRALAYAKRNLDTPLTVGQLAEAAHLSPRQFSRAFHAEPANRRPRRSRICASRPPADDGAEPPSDRGHRPANRFCRP